mmetsp:Transcript_16748/g.27077  ORF Transcript_16748/g.27077 Transcript_16748/m.27077 type:complete len:109 (-) Transcript_16748:52-378(-)
MRRCLRHCALGDVHPEVVSAHKRIGNVRYQRGDLANADDEYRKALSIYIHCFGQEHQTTKSAAVMVEKVAKEMAQQQVVAVTPVPPVSSSPSSTSFFKRGPKGYESLS